MQKRLNLKSISIAKNAFEISKNIFYCVPTSCYLAALAVRDNRQHTNAPIFISCITGTPSSDTPTHAKSNHTGCREETERDRE